MSFLVLLVLLRLPISPSASVPLTSETLFFPSSLLYEDCPYWCNKELCGDIKAHLKMSADNNSYSFYQSYSSSHWTIFSKLNHPT